MKTCSRSTQASPKPLVTAALAMILASALAAAADHDHSHPNHASHRTSSSTAKTAVRGVPAVTKLPPLPEGVTELKFSDFFVKPVGPRGLELNEKLRQLQGRRVRILGYMAHREVQPHGTFLLTPFPVEVHDHDNSLAEDFPASAVHVSVPTMRDKSVPHARGLMLLTGTLNVSSRPEEDGRVSLVRLELDPPGRTKHRQPAINKFPAPSGKGAERLMSSVGQRTGASH